MDIETRMAALERSVRWWRIGACVAGVALAAVVAVGAQRQPAVPDLVEAHGIRIVDDDGKEAFAVTADPAAGATLTLRVGAHRRKQERAADRNAEQPEGYGTAGQRDGRRRADRAI